MRDLPVKIRVPYPAAKDEIQLLVNVQNGFDSDRLDEAGIVPVDPGWLQEATEQARQVKVQEALFNYGDDNECALHPIRSVQICSQRLVS